MVTIASAAAYVRLSFGRWPVAYRDDVPARFADLAASVAALSSFALVLSIFLLPAVAIFRRLSHARPLGRWAAVLLICWLFALVLVRSDPTGFLDWAID